MKFLMGQNSRHSTDPGMLSTRRQIIGIPNQITPHPNNVGSEGMNKLFTERTNSKDPEALKILTFLSCMRERSEREKEREFTHIPFLVLMENLV